MPTTDATPPPAFPFSHASPVSSRGTKTAAGDGASPFAAEQQKLQQTLAQLENGKTDIDDQRKEAAREKIARIKAQIAALRLAGGDPRKVAREAARLARELAAAVRDYAGAGGGAADGGGIFSQSPAGTASAGIGAEITAAPVITAPEGGRQAQESAQIQASAASGTGRDDGSFAREARRLLDELKNLVRGAKRKLAGKAGGADTARADDALRSAEQAFSGLAPAFPAAAASFTLSV